MSNRRPSKLGKHQKRSISVSWRQIKIGLFIALILFFIYHASRKTIENFLLARDGEKVKGIVIRRIDVGGAAAVSLTYKFEVDGVEYVSEQSNEPYQVGDTIDILYLDINPRITRTYRFIKNNYETRL